MEKKSGLWGRWRQRMWLYTSQMRHLEQAMFAFCASVFPRKRNGNEACLTEAWKGGRGVEKGEVPRAQCSLKYRESVHLATMSCSGLVSVKTLCNDNLRIPCLAMALTKYPGINACMGRYARFSTGSHWRASGVKRRLWILL